MCHLKLALTDTKCWLMICKMPFRVLPNGEILCDTAQEAEALSRALRMEGAFLPNNQVPHHGPWTAKLLDTFLENLGPDQKAILRSLVTKTSATIDELRTVAGVGSNKGLAGVLSGISKQAAALGINPRAVFGIENRRRSGVLLKSYLVADEFQAIAKEHGWPGPPL